MTVLAVPSNRFRSFSFHLDRYESVAESTLSRTAQTVSIGAGTLDRWTGVFETLPLMTVDARRWSAFFDALGGIAGHFTVIDPGFDGLPAATQAHMAVSGLPTVAGGQGGKSIQVGNLPPSQAAALRAGDLVKIAEQVVRLTADLSTSSGGNGTAVFEPVLRQQTPSGGVMEVEAVTLTARLTEPHDPIEIGITPTPVSFAWTEVVI